MRRGRFSRVLMQDLERAFSWRFAISVLAIVLLMMLDNLWELRDAVHRSGYVVYYFFFNSIVFSGMLSIYGSAVACAIPYCGEASREYACGIQLQFVARAGRIRYLLSKFLSAVFSSGLCMSAGYLLFLGILSLFFPFVGQNTIETGMTIFPYVSYSMQNEIWLHVLIIVFNGFLTGALYGGISIAASTFFKDRLVIASIPFIARFIWIQIYRFIQLDEYSRLDMWLFMRTMHNTTPSTVLWSTLRVIVIVGVALYVYANESKRRIQGLESNQSM